MIKRQKPSKQVMVCIAVMILIILAFWGFTRENEQRIMEQNMEYIQDSTIQIAGRIDNVISDGYDNIRVLSSFLSQSLDRPEVDIEFVREKAQDTVFDFIEFADKDGMNHNITGGVSDAKDRQYYLDGMQGNVGLEVIFDSRATHETLLMFYAPVTFEDEIVGVLIGAYQAENKLAALLTATYFGETANLYLCTPQGRVAASNLPLDTKEALTIKDLAGDNGALAEDMQQTMQSGETIQFVLKSRKSGGCMTKLPKSGWFLIQIFPEAANVSMVHEANSAGIRLEMMLLLIFGVVLLVLIGFYRKERQNIAEIAEERGKYKNAVLADALIVYEADLAKNQIGEGIWKNKNGGRLQLENLIGLTLPCDYDAYIAQWADRYVDDRSREVFLANTDRNYLKQQFEQGKSEITFDYYGKSVEGKNMFLRRSTYLTADKKSGNVIVYNNVKDITEQKALIEDALLRAENASMAKTKFLSNMSHDIRTPLNAIIGFTTLAITHINDKERVRGYLEKIALSGNHLLSLINDVLDMSRIESGKMHLDESECDLAELMDELKNMLAEEMQSRNLKFHMDLGNMTDGPVICDRLRLKQILLNLLGNAIKFTEPGGDVWLRITEKPGENRERGVYEFYVKDTGIGMSEEFLQHIFEPFERERTSTVSGVQGTGLGMPITKNIVEMMDGTIAVNSKKGVGTEFIVELPMKKVVSIGQEDAAAGETVLPSLAQTSLEGQRILLVEDNELNREIAGEILGEEGLLVEEAEDGSIAVDMLLDKGPGYYRLVLMDIQMPVMDGYTATRTIREFENKELAAIPIIAMTANAFEEDRRKAFSCGMNGYVAKPIDVERLIDTMEQVLAAGV